MSEISFGKHMEQLSRKLAAAGNVPVDTLTANLPVKTGLNLKVKPPFCRSSKRCALKWEKHTRNHIWRLCRCGEGCNQQTAERDLGRVV